MKLLYKFASRSRPQKVLACLDNMTSMMHHDNYAIEITADIDDASMYDEVIKNQIEAYPHTRIHYGTSTSKIDAINRDMPLFTDWNILINMSDDMEFIMHGFDKQIISDYNTLSEGDVLMHYPDQAAGQALITMAIMDRKYFERDGYIYNPEYKSLFCDNEQHEVAKLRGRYKFFKKRLFNHNHPAWGFGSPDALMVHTESFHGEDKITFERRKAENFGIKMNEQQSIPTDEFVLTILICSLHSRRSMLEILLTELQRQVFACNAVGKVDILLNIDNKELSTGAKRQQLLEQATGKYIIFIDDDDWIEPCYIAELLKACASDADCFAMNGWITTNGSDRIDWRLSKNYEDHTIKENGYTPVYLRRTNHITGVKRSIALQAGFPDKSNAEDKWYSQRVAPLCKTEYQILPMMYHYRFSTHNKEYQ